MGTGAAEGRTLAARIARACYGEDPRVEQISALNNLVYRLRLSDGCRILKLAKGDGSGIRRELAVMSAVRDRNIPLPRVEHADREAALVGRPFFIMHSAGEQTVADHLHSAMGGALCAEMGRALGRIHGIEWAAAEATEAAAWRNDVERAYRLAEWAAGIGYLGRRDLREFTSMPVPPLDGRSLCHGDFHAVQCIVDGGRITAVVDWQSARLGHPLSDLAITHAYLDYYAAPPHIRSFLEGYAAVADLGPEYDRAYLPARVAQALALARVFHDQARPALAKRAIELARRYLNDLRLA